MSKVKTDSRKALSVILAVLMVLSTMVVMFSVFETKASALSTGTYYWRVRVNSDNDTGGWDDYDWKVYGKANNGTGGESQIGSFSQKIDFDEDGRIVGSGSSTSFPERVTFDYSFGGGVTWREMDADYYLDISSDNSNWTEIGSTGCSDSSSAFSAASGTKTLTVDSSKYPYAASASISGGASSITAYAVGGATYTASGYTASARDQYGVAITCTPTWSVSYSGNHKVTCDGSGDTTNIYVGPTTGNQVQKNATLTLSCALNSHTATATKAVTIVPTYKVNYDASANGGTVSGSGTTTATKTNTSTSSTTVSFSLPTATRSGWTFVGWNTSSTAHTGSTGSINLPYNSTYYAIFSRTFSYTYIYIDPKTNTKATETKETTVYNGATGSYSSQRSRNDVTIDGTTFKFVGYSLTPTAAAPEYTTTTISETAGTTAYAIYSADVTLSYNAGNGSPTPASETKTIYLTVDSNGNIINPGADFTVSTSDPSYAGGPFKGWSTDSAAESVQYASGASINIKKNTTLYACYGLYKFTVTFKDASGNVINTQTVGYGNAATAPADPAKAADDDYEYIFAGWDTDFSSVTSDLTVSPKEYTKKAHEWTITPVTLPDCTTVGYNKYVCNNCGYEKIVEVAALDHSPSTEKGYDATCTTAGMTDKIVCTRCGEVIQEKTVIDALGHDYQLTKTVEATCSANGYDVYTCSRCGLTEQRNVVSPNYDNHTLVEIPAVAATCTTSGSTQGWKCSVCGATITSPKTVIAEGHKWIAATCTTAKTCSVCGKTEGEALGHDYAEIEAKAATCTENGYTAGKRCTRCGDVPEGSEVKVIPATGHKWVETAREEATCAKEGTITYTCSVCSETKTETIEKLPHTEVAIPDVAATCTKEGSKGGTKCSVCGEIVVEPEVVAKLAHSYELTSETVNPTCQATGKTAVYTCSVCGATKGGTTLPKVGHAYGAWTVTKAATCTTDGEKVRSCIYGCGLAETKTLTAVGHMAVSVKEVAATCTTAGLTAGKKCAVCGTVLEGCTTIPALTHNYQAYKTVAATCESEGYTEYKCTNCGSTYEDDFVDATGHTVEAIPAVQPTCTSLGYTEGSKCKVCGKILAKQETINKVAHEKVEFGAVAATCTETGMKAGVKCAVCGRVFSNPTETAALGHTEDAGTVTTIATCVTEGVKTYKCVRCGEVMRTESLGYGNHTLPSDYTLEGGMLKFTCPVCGQSVECNPSVYGMADNGCEKCGLHHQANSVLFKYNGLFCKIIGFFRSLFKIS